MSSTSADSFPDPFAEPNAELAPEELPDPLPDVERVVAEETAAARHAASVAAGRRIGGTAGAALAGAMLAVGEIYDGPRKDDTIVAVAESPDEPGDIDDGIDVVVDGGGDGAARHVQTRPPDVPRP